MKTNTTRLVIMVIFISLISCNNSRNTQRTDTTSVAQTDDEGILSETTEGSRNELMEFATEAANGGMMEVELGRIAQQHAANQRVKDFGAMMVRDHQKANAELKKLAVEKSIKLPDSVSGKHREHIEDLKKKRGVEFDKAYMKMMIDDHQDDVDEFEDAAKDLSDVGLRAFASKTLPVLKVHLDSAKAINKTVQATLHPGDVSEGIERQTYP